MQINKPNKESGKGIYAISERINPLNWFTAVRKAREMAKWLHENNGEFDGNFPRAYAIAHCQVEDDRPFAFSVLAKEFLTKKSDEDFYHKAPAMFNARIVSAPDEIEHIVPVRKMVGEKGSKDRHIEIVREPKMVSNVVRLKEGCMSFPDRKERTVTRYFRIKVRYITEWHYIPVWHTEWIEGLKAHIFQHEVEHFNGKNIHYKS